MRSCSRHPERCARATGRVSRQWPGFTLVELLVVIGITLLLTVMTIGAINLSITSERVRSGARQVQSLIEGSRDRSIYAGEPRGIRLLVNEQVTETIDGVTIPTLATTLVYIGSPGQDVSNPQPATGGADPWDQSVSIANPTRFPRDPTMPPGALNVAEEMATRAVMGFRTNWTTLYERGLIGPGSKIRLDPDNPANSIEYTIDPRSFPIRRESDWFNGAAVPGFPAITLDPAFTSFDVNASGTDDEVIFLTFEHNSAPNGTTDPFITGTTLTTTWPFSIQLNPDVLPGEEASTLPRNVCIDLETSHLPEGWVTTTPAGNRQFSSQMDLLFSPSGAVIGDAGVAGLIHLHVSDVGDAIFNVPPGSQTVDGTTTGEPRNGSEFGITIFTRSGRVIVHPIDWGNYPVPGTEFRNLTFDDAGDFDGNPNTKGYWQANVAYSTGEIVAPTLYNGLFYVAVASTGSAGASEPKWNLAPGGRTVDNGVTWVGVKHSIWRFGEEGEVAK